MYYFQYLIFLFLALLLHHLIPFLVQHLPLVIILGINSVVSLPSLWSGKKIKSKEDLILKLPKCEAVDYTPVYAFSKHMNILK